MLEVFDVVQWETGAGPTDGSGASVRQVVAFNVRRARIGRGLTQQELGERLEAATGTPWSRATVGHAEAGWGTAPGRVRHFDVNEVAALALILTVPIPWFFLPPSAMPTGYPPTSHQDCWITSREDDQDVALSISTLAAMALPDAARAASDDLFWPRVAAELPQFLPADDEAARALALVREIVDLVHAYDDGDL